MTNKLTRGNRAVRYSTLLLTTAAVILTLLAISVLMGENVNPETPEPTSMHTNSFLDMPKSKAISAENLEPVPDEQFYTITLSGSELRLHTPDKPDSYTVLDGIDPRTLRESDREALEAGLRLESAEALVRFLEDFSS